MINNKYKFLTYFVLIFMPSAITAANKDILHKASSTSTQHEFIRVADDNWHFETELTGEAFIPYGVNYYDPGTFHDTPYPAYDVIGAFDSVTVDRQLEKVSELGANVIRIFLSVVSFEPDLFSLNETSFEKLDTLVRIAKQHNLRIIFDLINDWEGVPSWESWEYYADEQTIRGYEFFLEALGRRYADEPAIFSWSLKNEPYARGPDSGIMGDLWTPYVQFKYKSESALAAAWNDYPRAGEYWEQIKQPDYSAEYVPFDSPESQRFYDYQVFREDIAYNWVRRLSRALRRTDPNHMITIGLDQHSAPIKHVTGFEKTYTAFNPIKIAPLLDYISMHAYNWWDSHVSTFVKAVARYCYTDKPVVIEEFNLHETESTVMPFLDSSGGWLHWAAFETPGFDWTANLLDESGNITPLGTTFRRIADWIYDTVPVRVPDAARVDVDLKQALTSVNDMNDIYQDYIDTANTTSGPVGFRVLNYQGPMLLGRAAFNIREKLIIGKQVKIGWEKIDWPILSDLPVTLMLSRDGGDTWQSLAGNIVGQNYHTWTVTEPASNSVRFKVIASMDANVYSENSKEFIITNPTRVSEKSQPAAFKLYQNHPNPFNPSTVIQYQITSSQNVHMAIFNQAGQLVRTLVQDHLSAGIHHVEWNGLNNVSQPVSSGIYLYRLQSDDQIKTKRMILLR